MSVPIKFTDLLDAFEWVSALPLDENSAYISKLTGSVHLTSDSMDVELEELEELPEDLDDAAAYFSVPHKNELDLGSHLAQSFIDEVLPKKSEKVRAIFSQRGAYARFKDLLEHEDLLDVWYRYEAEATERALREWAQDNELQLDRPAASADSR
jgi:Uncharacterised protein family (UPF0158)